MLMIATEHLESEVTEPEGDLPTPNLDEARVLTDTRGGADRAGARAASVRVAAGRRRDGRSAARLNHLYAGLQTLLGIACPPSSGTRARSTSPFAARPRSGRLCAPELGCEG